MPCHVTGVRSPLTHLTNDLSEAIGAQSANGGGDADVKSRNPTLVELGWKHVVKMVS